MPDIILKNRNGENIDYPAVKRLRAKKVDGGTQIFGAYDPETLTPEKLAKGEAVGNITGTMTVPTSEEKTIAPDFSGGDIEVTPGEGAMFSKVTVQKPETLIPENIAEGVDIAGIIGTLVAGGGGKVVRSYKFFKPTSAASYTIEHGLGMVPDLAICFADESSTANKCILWIGSSAAAVAAEKSVRANQVWYLNSSKNFRAASSIGGGIDTGTGYMNADETSLTLKPYGNATIDTGNYHYLFCFGGLT